MIFTTSSKKVIRFVIKSSWIVHLSCILLCELFTSHQFVNYGIVAWSSHRDVGTVF